MRDLFTIYKVGVISSADAGSAGYKSFCWLESIVDSYLWKENTVFYSKKVFLGVENLGLVRELFTDRTDP